MKFVLLLLVLPIMLNGVWESEQFTVENERLISNQVNDVFFYDTRNDLDGGLWRLSSGNSWYNEPSNPADDFWGSDIDDARWNEWDTGNYFTINNQVHFLRSGAPNQYYESNLTSTWDLSGDFDIIIDFNLLQWNPAQFMAESSIRLEFWVNESNFCKLWRYRHTDDNYWGEFWINGFTHHGRETTGVGSEYNGKLRLTRTGNLLEMWRFRTSDKSWQRVHHRADFSNQAGQVRIAFTNYYTTMEATVDNFIMNAGETSFSNLGSAHRGMQNAFPEQAIVVRTDTSLDIFDAENKNLWMRFTGIPQNDGAIAGGSNLVYAQNGRIYTTWNEAYHGLTLIDFNTDEIYYLSDSYNQKYGYDIAGRNQMGDWTNITPQYYLATDEINHISGCNWNGNEIIGFASENGIRIVKNQETVYQSSYTNLISTLHFNTIGKLLFSTPAFIATSGANYLTANFSHFNTTYISNTTDLTSNDDFLFAASAAGVHKLNINPLSDTGTIYTNTLGLAPTSSNQCIGVFVFNDTLFVASSHATNGAISAVEIVNNEFLFSIEGAETLSPASNAFSAGLTAIYDRNLLWATNNGLDYFYGSSGLVKGVTIEADGGEVHLTWGRVIPATVYHIYRDEIPNFEVSTETFLDSCTETNYTDNSFTKYNVKYFYRITWE
jgi:hypothetical protein